MTLTIDQRTYAFNMTKHATVSDVLLEMSLDVSLWWLAAEENGQLVYLSSSMTTASLVGESLRIVASMTSPAHMCVCSPASLD